MISMGLGDIRVDFLEQIAICEAEALVMERLPGKSLLCDPVGLRYFSDLPHCPDEMQLQWIGVANGYPVCLLLRNGLGPTLGIPFGPDPCGISWSRMAIGPLGGIAFLDQVLSGVLLASRRFPCRTDAFNDDDHS